MNNKPINNNDAAEQYEIENLKIDLHDDTDDVGIFSRLWKAMTKDVAREAVKVRTECDSAEANCQTDRGEK